MLCHSDKVDNSRMHNEAHKQSEHHVVLLVYFTVHCYLGWCFFWCWLLRTRRPTHQNCRTDCMLLTQWTESHPGLIEFSGRHWCHGCKLVTLWQNSAISKKITAPSWFVQIHRVLLFGSYRCLCSALHLKGQFTPKLKNTYFPLTFSAIYQSRLFWCESSSFWDFCLLSNIMGMVL